MKIIIFFLLLVAFNQNLDSRKIVASKKENIGLEDISILDIHSPQGFYNMRFRSYISRNAFFTDKAGNIYIWHRRFASYCLFIWKKDHFDVVSGLSYKPIEYVFNDKQKNLWVQLKEGGAKMFNGEIWNEFNDPELTLTVNFEDEKKIYFLTEKALYEFDGNDFVKTSLNQEISFGLIVENGTSLYSFGNRFLKDVENTFWFVNGDLYSINNGEVIKYDKKKTLNKNIDNLFMDKNGRLWVFGQNGINSIDGTEWKFYQLKNKGYSKDNDDNFLFSTDEGIKKWTNGNITLLNSNTSNDNKNALSGKIIYVDSKNNIWCDNYGYLYKYNNDTTIFINPTQPFSFAFYQILEDSNRKIWIYGIEPIPVNNKYDPVYCLSTTGFIMTYDNDKEKKSIYYRGVMTGTDFSEICKDEVNYNRGFLHIYEDTNNILWIETPTKIIRIPQELIN